MQGAGYLIFRIFLKLPYYKFKIHLDIKSESEKSVYYEKVAKWTRLLMTEMNVVTTKK